MANSVRASRGAGATLTRRGMLRGAALGAAALGAVPGVSALAAEKSSAVADKAEAWDAEYDVVVLGLGGAGANAAVAAYEEGAKVLVCEKAAEGAEPCNTKAAGQNVIATDDADALYAYFTALMGKFNNYDEEALRAFCDGAAGNWDWAVDVLGMDPDVACPKEVEKDRVGPCKWVHSDNAWGMGREGYMPLWDEFPELEGSEHCYNILVGAATFDAAYFNLCMSAVKARTDGEKLTVWYDAPGKRLVTDASGAVTGVIVEKDGKELHVKANGGVCLCTGGFEANPDMISDFTQMPYTYLQAGTTNTGDGIQMAQRVGARIWHTSNVSGFMWAYQNPSLSTCTQFRSRANGIVAGLNGARFQNEDAANRHGRINIGGRWISTPMPLPAYYIVDANAIATPFLASFSDGNVDEIAQGLVIEGEDIADLSQKIRDLGEAPDFNANGELDAALAAYNAHCHAEDDAGKVDDFGRTCKVPVETAPFYAIKIGPTQYNTQGGPRHNGLAQVLDLDNMPIEGLFEGGEMGSVFADMYNGGGNLSETMVFGRYAGQNAAKRAKGEFKGATEPAMTHSEKLAAAAAQAKAQSVVDVASVPDGSYEGSGQGYGGKITLSVTVKGGKITACEVEQSSESADIGEKALPDYCAAIVDVQDPEKIDVSTGASNTLRGFVAAVEDALAQA